jgi:hypothetical protein
VVRVTGHAYPWDVVGDPSFPGRARDLGVDSVTLAAAYHATRAATPLHPRHQIVDARGTALYRPIREPVWAGRRLRPIGPEWMDAPDPYRQAAAALRAAGLRVDAWVVLTHDSRLGRACPDLAVVNCFGERYPYALCPAHEEVRDYAATLAAEAVRDAPADGVSLEACGQLGVTHAGPHEKTDGAWTAEAARWLSVCCCAGCQAAWSARGLDPEGVLTALRGAVHAQAHGAPGRELRADVAAALLAVRHDTTDRLRAQTIDGVRNAAPAAALTLHAQPDPWATGPSPGLPPGAAKEVDRLLVPAWPTTGASADLVAAATATGAPVDAYVTGLPPARPDDLPAHVGRLLAAGASGIALYHLGLAPRAGQATLAALATQARDWRPA